MLGGSPSGKAAPLWANVFRNARIRSHQRAFFAKQRMNSHRRVELRFAVCFAKLRPVIQTWMVLGRGTIFKLSPVSGGQCVNPPLNRRFPVLASNTAKAVVKVTTPPPRGFPLERGPLMENLPFIST